MSKGTGFLADFRKFAIKGNAIDLAVGVIIGAAFSKIVDSLVKDIIMPVINFLVGGAMDFSNKFVVLSMPPGYAGPMTYADLSKAGAVVLAWGNFITILINFILLAFIIFLMVRAIARARDRFEAEETPAQSAVPAAPPPDVQLLSEIRDLLKERRGPLV